MRNTYKILIGIGAGIAAGAILGTLLAPDKGSRTRRKINDQGKKMADEVKNTFFKYKEKANDLKEDIQQVVKEKVNQFV